MDRQPNGPEQQFDGPVYNGRLNINGSQNNYGPAYNGQRSYNAPAYSQVSSYEQDFTILRFYYVKNLV